MTEKRFHFGYVLGDTGLIDEQAEHKWFIENCCSITDLKKNWETVCEKLNEVAEENEQLKQRINVLDDQITAQGIVIEGYQNRNQKLFDENEQLKQQLRIFSDGLKAEIRETKEIFEDYSECVDEKLELKKENEQLKVILSNYMKQIDKLCIKKGLLEQQLSLIDKLIDDLGSEEMRRQYKIIML